MQDFWDGLLQLYRANKNVIDKKLHLRIKGENRLYDFCTDLSDSLSHEYLCLLALVLSNVLGRRMPDHIHNRMILGESNRWVKNYVEYASKLRPAFWGFNRNENNFRNVTLGRSGTLVRTTLK